MPARAPKDGFGPRTGPRKRRSGPERAFDKFADLLSLSLSINFLLHVRTSPYISIHLFTLFFHVLLRCLFGPRKRSLGPESGPERGVRAPKEHLTSSDLLSLSPLYIYIFPFTCPYISIHLYTSLYLFFHVLFSMCCLFGPRKRSSGPESGPARGVRAPKEHLTSSDLLSLSLYIYINFPLHVRTSPYISYLVFLCSRVLPLRAPKEQFGPERTVDKFRICYKYIYISFSVRFFNLRISIHLFTVFSYDLLLCLLGMVQDGPRVKILVTTLLYYAIPLLFFPLLFLFNSFGLLVMSFLFFHLSSFFLCVPL